MSFGPWTRRRGMCLFTLHTVEQGPVGRCGRIFVLGCYRSRDEEGDGLPVRKTTLPSTTTTFLRPYSPRTPPV